MTDESYPPEGHRRNLIRRIERQTVHEASAVVFTAPGTLNMYAARYPDVPAERWRLILNGYDEESFQAAEALPVGERSDKTVILHSGVIYPEERDPSDLFRAIATLKQQGRISAGTLEVRLRASGHDAVFKPVIEELQIGDIVTLLPAVSYDRALAEMMNVDGLLLLQAPSCNHQIPAKIYEYARAGKPVLALTDRAGDTAELLGKLCPCEIAPLDSASGIAASMSIFIAKIQRNEFEFDFRQTAEYSRKAQARRTVELFESVVDEQRSAT